MPRGRDIGSLNYRIALKFGMHGRGACKISEWSNNSEQILRLRDFTECYDETFYRILKQGPDA